MSTDSLLKISAMHRRSVLSVLTLLLVLTVLAFLLLSSGWKETLREVLSFVGSALASIIVAYIIFVKLISKGEAGLFELEPREITKEFDVLISEAGSWSYKGNFGRYLRGKVLPALSQRGSRANVVACVIDPLNRSLCEKHANYRGRINSIDKGVPYTADTVSLQVLVTLVICSWYEKNKGMDIRVYLTQTYDPVRIDSSDSSMIITVEDRRSPALKINKGHFMFDHFNFQVSTVKEQGRKVDISGVSRCDLSAVTAEDVTAVLHSSGLSELLKTIPVDEILKACKEARNPYEN
uniref:hypothetical protein n=1 Tax=Xanthomonas sp. 0924 TaxID=2835534 RepID=UPI003F7E0E08